MADVVERVRKLLAIKAGSGASPQEVETAAKLAQELIQEHRLTEADVTSTSDDGSVLVDIPAGKKGFMATWRFALVTSVARAFFCEAIGLRSGKSRKVRIVGRRDDAEVVLAVTAFLTDEIERLTSEYASQPDELFLLDELVEGSTPAERKRAYRSGLAFGVSTTLAEQAKKWREASEKALAVYRQGRSEIRGYMSSRFGESKVKTVADPAARLTAFDEGVARGLEIKVGPTMGKSEEHRGKGDSGHERERGNSQDQN